MIVLRQCGYCRAWMSRPCGEQCLLSVNDPTWEQLTAQGIEAATAGETVGLDPTDESPVAESEAPNPADPTIPNNPTSSMGERP